MSNANETLTDYYQGKLTREVISFILVEVMKKKGLSIRKTAKLLGVGANVIQKIKSCDASIDQGIRTLEALGCEFEMHVSFKDTENPAPEQYEPK